MPPPDYRKNLRPDRIGEEEREYEYKLLETLDKEGKYKLPRTEEQPVETILEREKEIRIRTREKVQQEMIKIVSTDVEPLKQIGNRLVGDLFDRAKFLKDRTAEIERTIEERRQIHEGINVEIDADIKDREKLLATTADLEKIREFKMDMTLLRMEKRRENANFWRDLIGLNRELKELQEQFAAEAKIANLFTELNR